MGTQEKLFVVEKAPKKKYERRQKLELTTVFHRGAGVPGGHLVISDGVREPFVTSMRECSSIELRHSDFVVDVGAYVGTYALRCARFPVRRVVAYEPTPFSFSVLQKNAASCRNLELANVAVTGDARESVDFYLSRKTGVSNSIVASRAKDPITVPAVSYVEAVREATVVKIDVEGAEYDYPIVQPGIRALIVDFHKIGKDWVSKAEAVVAKIESAGFIPVIRPRWSHGWTSCGSWVRQVSSSSTAWDYELMFGSFCCGCGAKTLGYKARTLCHACFDSWEPKYHVGFQRSIT